MADHGAGDPRAGAFAESTAFYGSGPGDGCADAVDIAASSAAESDWPDYCLRDPDGAASDFAGVVFELSGDWHPAAHADVGFAGGGRRESGQHGGELLVDGVVSVRSAGGDAFVSEFYW